MHILGMGFQKVANFLHIPKCNHPNHSSQFIFYPKTSSLPNFSIFLSLFNQLVSLTFLILLCGRSVISVELFFQRHYIFDKQYIFTCQKIVVLHYSFLK